MRVGLLLYTALSSLVVARIVPSSKLSSSNISPNHSSHDIVPRELAFESVLTTTHVDPAYDQAAELGGKIYTAMRTKDSVARWLFKNYPHFTETVQSPYDGDLRAELRTWGYQDDEELSKKIEKECDFDKYHHMKPVFDELGLDTKAKMDGGPNECFRIDHMNGPAIKRNPDGTLPGESKQFYDVCGKEYQARFKFSFRSVISG